VVDAAEAELDEAEVELREQLELERLATTIMSTAALRRLGPLRERLRDPGGAPSSDADRFRLGLMALDRPSAARPWRRRGAAAVAGEATAIASSPPISTERNAPRPCGRVSRRRLDLAVMDLLSPCCRSEGTSRYA
jgi:hypothetical protein